MVLSRQDYLSIIISLIIILILSNGILIHKLNNRNHSLEEYKIESNYYKQKFEQYYEKYNKIKNEYETFIKVNYFVKITVTAYTNSVDETNSDPHNTSLMEDPVPGWTCAVSRDLSYLLGKKIYIERVGIRKVTDLMNKRFTKRVDILVPNKQHAKEFGKKKNIKIVPLMNN